MRVTMCDIAFHREKVNPKYISIDAEYVNASPHGLILLDRKCPRRGLEIDFSDTGLDAGATTLKDNLWMIRLATGTFRGMLSRDHASARLMLTIQSLLNFQSKPIYPEEKPEPIHLPEPQWPKWPPAL